MVRVKIDAFQGEALRNELIRYGWSDAQLLVAAQSNMVHVVADCTTLAMNLIPIMPEPAEYAYDWRDCANQQIPYGIALAAWAHPAVRTQPTLWRAWHETAKQCMRYWTSLQDLGEKRFADIAQWSGCLSRYSLQGLVQRSKWEKRQFALCRRCLHR